MKPDLPGEIRSDEGLDESRLGTYLRDVLPSADGEIEIQQFHGGSANLTYALSLGGQEIVLRRPPLGPVAPKAHDMRREYRGLAALAPHYPHSPRPIHLCEDESVIGAVFLLMERRHGFVIRDRWPDELGDSPELRGRMSESLIDGLADLHRVDTALPDVAALGKPEGFVARQVNGWSGRWERAKTRELTVMDDLNRWLTENLPESQYVSVVHNDYKLDNTIYDLEDPGRLSGVFDWDMVTIGDPLVDLGTLMGYWPEASDQRNRGVKSAITQLPGFYTRRQLTERYAEATGYDVSGLPYYEAFALFKTAVVIEQIYVRWVKGQTQDARFEGMGQIVEPLAQAAWEIVSKL